MTDEKCQDVFGNLYNLEKQTVKFELQVEKNQNIVYNIPCRSIPIGQDQKQCTEKAVMPSSP